MNFFRLSLDQGLKIEGLHNVIYDLIKIRLFHQFTHRFQSSRKYRGNLTLHFVGSTDLLVNRK